MCFFFFKQRTEYELRMSDCSSDVCSSDLAAVEAVDRLLQPVCSHRSFPFGAGRRSLTQELRQASQEVLDILLGGEEVRRDADPAVVRPDENCLFCGAAHNGLGIGAAKADVASMALLPCRRHHFNPRPAEPGNQPLRQGADMGGNGLDRSEEHTSEHQSLMR